MNSFIYKSGPSNDMCSTFLCRKRNNIWYFLDMEVISYNDEEGYTHFCDWNTEVNEEVILELEEIFIYKIHYYHCYLDIKEIKSSKPYLFYNKAEEELLSLPLTPKEIKLLKVEKIKQILESQ